MNTLVTTAPPTSGPLVARQPIYDRRMRVAAYELLIQGERDVPDPTAISELGLSLVMGRLAYIPASAAFLAGRYAFALPAERVVLKIEPDARDQADSLRELALNGYALAFSGGRAEVLPDTLIASASVVGIPVGALERGDLRAEVANLRERGAASLLAEGVAHQEQLDLCLELGFDLLSGYFFCEPRVVAQRGVQVSRINRIRLAAALQSLDVQLEDVEEIISRDVGLSYNLLRFINSAFFSLPRRVESIRDALVLLGVLNIRRWATLMALAGADDKPRELVVTGLVRGRMCELLAQASGYEDSTSFFTTGLFSVVDALTDTSMVELLASLPLSQDIIQALLNHDGAKGRILRAVVAYERGGFETAAELLPPALPVGDIYAASVAWATEASGAVG